MRKCAIRARAHLQEKKERKKKPKSKLEVDANHQVYTLLMDTLQNRMIGMMIFDTLNKIFDLLFT